MTADMTRQEVKFIRWDVPDKKQDDLLDLVRDGEYARIDKGHCVFTALGETAAAFWKNGGNRMEYVKTMPDGTDGDLLTGTIPKVTGTSACYCKLDVVTDRRIDLGQKMPDWIEVREYHPDVEKSYWDAHLTPIWIKTKKINFIEFVGYVKPPKGEGFKP